MLLDAGMDSGPVFKQAELPVADEDTAGSLSEKLANLGAELLTEVLPLWIEGKIKPKPQNDSSATYTSMLTREDGRIDWDKDAVDIWRKVRAFQPWPGCFTIWMGKNLKIAQVTPVDLHTTIEAGKIISLSSREGSSVGVGCGKGVLALERLQLEGKREMTGEEFIRGQRDFIGSKLL
jgi:methionyl-tRNA formyltransferase